VIGVLTGLGHLFTTKSARMSVLRRVVERALGVTFTRPNHRIVFQNSDDLALFLADRAITPEHAVLIKGSGVDPAVYRPTPPPDGPPLVVLAARMLRDKGIEDFVQAAEMLKEQGIQARFALAGDPDPGNPTAIPEEELQQWHRKGVIEYWGKQTDMLKIFTNAHIACLPSLREGVPKALIEAACCGRPLVATDVPGCREIVQDGVNGFLVPPHNARALARALGSLIEDPALRERMGARARQIAAADFSLQGVIDKNLAVYSDVLPPARGKRCLRQRSALAKRSLDTVVSGVALLFLAPLMMAIAIAVRIGSPGPVFYKGLRVGAYGRRFRILKFRSMVVNAEKLGGSATATDDPRITKIGAFLRRHKLDELPQLLNVLSGDMSLVGPRPEVPKYVDRFTEEERETLALRPGITDWASIWNADEGAVLEGSSDPERTYEELVRPTKLALQLYYLRNQSLAADLRILLYTAMKLARHDWLPKELTPYGRIKRFKDVATA
jgi:lipopolysaccharide/colanic/teichoic acid biosynthesis glycosyltransferase